MCSWCQGKLVILFGGPLRKKTLVDLDLGNYYKLNFAEEIKKCLTLFCFSGDYFLVSVWWTRREKGMNYTIEGIVCLDFCSFVYVNCMLGLFCIF